MRFASVSIVAALLLSGCVEPEPPAKSPAVLQLEASCSAGDTYACAQIAQMEQERRIAVAQIMASGPPVYIPPNQPMPPMMGGGQTCNYTAYGGVVRQVCY